MFCSQCGIQLPDNARFCMSCGQPQVGTADATGNLEMCVIDWEYADDRRIVRPKVRVVAKATGSGGQLYRCSVEGSTEVQL